MTVEDLPVLYSISLQLNAEELHENKISLCKLDFSKKMNLEQRLKIQKNYRHLLDELHADEIVDNLFSNVVISHDDLQRVHLSKTDKDKARCLIDILFTTKNSFEPFLKELESFHRPDLVEKIRKTDVSEELKKDFSEDHMIGPGLENIPFVFIGFCDLACIHGRSRKKKKEHQNIIVGDNSSYPADGDENLNGGGA